MIDIIKKWHDMLFKSTNNIRPFSKLEPIYPEDNIATYVIDYVCNHIWYITRSDHYHLLIRGDNFNVDLWNGNKNMSGYTGWCSRGQTELNGTKYTWEDAMPSMETLIKLDILIEQYYLNKFKENTK